jgi:hypothetical protein
MSTTYRWIKTIAVEVRMADNGETFEGEPVHITPEEQLESAREHRDDAVTIWTEEEPFITIKEGDWQRVEDDAD